MKTLKQIISTYTVESSPEDIVYESNIYEIIKEWLQQKLFYYSPTPNYKSPETNLLKELLEELK